MSTSNTLSDWGVCQKRWGWSRNSEKSLTIPAVALRSCWEVRNEKGEIAILAIFVSDSSLCSFCDQCSVFSSRHRLCSFSPRPWVARHLVLPFVRTRRGRSGNQTHARRTFHDRNSWVCLHSREPPRSDHNRLRNAVCESRRIPA